MNVKPTLTYFGSGPLFRSIESQILNAIPLDSCEWRRTFQRPTKHVRLEAQTVPFNEKALEKYKKGEWSILNQPILHIFIAECNDVDTYKSSIKEEIEKWFKLLSSYDVLDWMILLVETLDVRKTKNLIPRTTVLEKIRLDFCAKNDDRCISVLNPAKFEQKSTESFRCLVQRIRFLMLTSYNRNIAKYEELIRSKREKRNQENWDFRNYFFMQEDLALVYEKLELYTEALIQYDELDAMFSQFITNSGCGEKFKWLQYFKEPLSSFQGINLNRPNKFESRSKIMQSLTLLEFRNYLFERQAHLLHLNNDLPEIARRLPSFLFSTIREVEFIKLDCLDGGIACWEFVCALEVLQVCEEYMEPNEGSCFQQCAPVWNLAKDKLYELGKLCGLLPGLTPTSEQLHCMVQLSAGIGDAPIVASIELINASNPQVPNSKRDRSPNRRPKKPPPEQLKEALSSNAAFQKLYLELAELAISTYKHVSRLRSARLVGLELGKFYCALNEPHKAVGFFTDLLRELKAEAWQTLSAQTLLELANCYRKMGDALAYTKTCGAIACCQELETLVRTFYFDEFLKSIKTLKSCLSAQPSMENANNCMLEDNFRLCDIELQNGKPILQDNTLTVQVQLKSYYPREIVADAIKLSYEMYVAQPLVEATVATAVPTKAINKSQSQVPKREQIKMTLHLDFKQDNTLECASVACDEPKTKQPIRRTSSTKRKLSPSVQSDFSNCVTAENIVLQPGLNTIELNGKANRVGKWEFKQLCIHICQLEFLSEHLPFKIDSFEIITIPASATLNFSSLVAGIEQPVHLLVSGGSFIFSPDAKITLKCSRNLRIRLAKAIKQENMNESVKHAEVDEDTSFENVLDVYLPDFKSFEERDISLEVFTEIPGRKMLKPLAHYIGLSCPWSRNELQIPMTFQAAMEAFCHLNTCGTQKFLQVIVKGLETTLCLSRAKLRCDESSIVVTDLNPEYETPIILHKSLTVSYLYEIDVKSLKSESRELPVIKVNFTLKYSSMEKPEQLRNFGCAFDLVDYLTLFVVHASLEPTELLRVKSVCTLTLKITKLLENPFEDLMYEVLSDQNLWAVCGRSLGVISMKGIECHTITLDVMPLSTGYLPMPSIRLAKYTSSGKHNSEAHSKVHPFPQGQVYIATKSLQFHVIAGVNGEQ